MKLQHKDVLDRLSTKIKELVTKWKFDDEDKYIYNVKGWLCNFTADEIPFMMQILSLLQIKKEEDTNTSLETIAEHILHQFTHDLGHVHFFPLSIESASSGSQFQYPLSRKLSHGKATFHDTYNDNIKYAATALVFIDDMIGSGKQAEKFYKAHLSSLKVPCYYYSLYGYKNGLDYLRKNTGFKIVFSPNIITDKDKLFSTSSPLENKERCKQIAMKYGKLLYPDHPLGYEDSQAMICFTDNCPNNTIPIIWAGRKNEMNQEMAWQPLFERKKIKKTQGTILHSPIVQKFDKATELVDFFYSSIMSRHFEQAFYCFDEKFRLLKYRGLDNLQYFIDGYSNTDSIKGRPRTLMIHDEEGYSRILVHYYETANVYKFKELQDIGSSSLGDLKRVYTQLNEFKNLLKQLGAEVDKVDNIPLHLFFSLNAVEDATWSCGISHEIVKKEFKSQRRAVARIKYFDCINLPGVGWRIHNITPAFPTGEPYI